MNWTVQCVEYYLYRGVSRTNAYEFMQQSGECNGFTRKGSYFRRFQESHESCILYF